MFSQVCVKNSVHRGVCLQDIDADAHWEDLPPPPGTATAADGPHPTGIYPCIWGQFLPCAFLIIFVGGGDGISNITTTKQYTPKTAESQALVLNKFIYTDKSPVQE